MPPRLVLTSERGRNWQMMSALVRAPLHGRRPADNWIQIQGPLGDAIYVAFSDAGISFVSPAVDPADFVMRHFERTGRMAQPADASDHQELVNAIRGGGATPELCDLEHLPPFTRRVLESVCTIPRGETRSHDWVAREIGMPDTARAVANSLATNPVPLVIPCHRVLADDGALGEHPLGRATKRALLAAEGLELPTAV